MTDHQYTQCIGLNCVFESINVDWGCWILVFSRTNWTVLLFVHCTSNILCSLHVCTFLRTKIEWFWTPLLLIMIICIWQTYSTFTNKIENKPCIPTIPQSPLGTLHFKLGRRCHALSPVDPETQVSWRIYIDSKIWWWNLPHQSEW